MRAIDTVPFTSRTLTSPRPVAATVPLGAVTHAATSPSTLSGPSPVRERGAGLRAATPLPIPRSDRTKAARPRHQAPRRTY
ncbi:hypothetical protein [Streptomyces sp. NPDC126503]|uniref:hypothetical protein n=1 Tax=Streptomyces sp. NPDC126503 TaxID=3155315 RepID=UPI00332D25FC